MATKRRYTNEPIGLEVIPDFLPPPEKLVRREETVKVTLVLDKFRVEFFKRHARRSHVPCQRVIRRVLDLYAARHR
ncbi:MAG TPA: CopG family transcriptional regulator [Planctomycetota bacterium]|nr:CopG family transcriptional regulator [Planctomycetota bacterium]HRR80222.1 CopG family transcriptional regulator [Planctomycetota bacterium]HRT93130.1 CopG family transcriptional regulator [Planctomycetota bacterium]